MSSLNNESSSDSSGDESFRSSRSIIFSSGRSSSPAWSRSSSMTSGTSAKSTTSSESRRRTKAKLGPISRPTPTELKPGDTSPGGDGQVQQQSSQESSPNVVQQIKVKNKKKSFALVRPKLVNPITNMPPPPAGVIHTYPGPMYGPPVPYYHPPPMMYYPPPPPAPMAYHMPVPYSVPMPPPPMGPPMYSHPQVRYVSVQAHYTCTTWTYIDYA